MLAIIPSMPHLPNSRIRWKRRRAITSGCPWDLVPLGPADKGSLVEQKGAAAAAWDGMDGMDGMGQVFKRFLQLLGAK